MNLLYSGLYLSVAVLAALLCAFGAVACGIWLLVRRLRSTPLGRVVPALAIACVVGLGSFLFAVTVTDLALGDLPPGSNMRKFDESAWKSDDSIQWGSSDVTVRQMMLGDVVRSVLPGKTRGEIEADLGYATEPLEESGGLRAMDYETGPQRDSLMRIDSEWLRVWIDRSDRFVGYELWSD